MENKFAQEITNPTSEETEMNPVMGAVQLNLEMEKSRIREEILASEALRRRELEAEVRMELMMEQELMGMRRFEGFSSIDHSLSMKSGFLGSQFRPIFDEKFLNLGASDDKLGDRMKLISHSSGGVGEFLQNDSNQLENKVFGSEEMQQMQEIALGKRPFERVPGSAVAQLAGESMDESSKEQLLSQANPSSGFVGTKRKAEALAETNDEETAPAAATKDSQQMKWYCSLCGVSATSEGGLSSHFQGKKHKAKEARSSSMSIDSVSTENSLQLSEQEKTPSGPNKWHCSLCEVFVSSEVHLRAHLQGKKHKSKEAKLGLDQNIGSVEEVAKPEGGEMDEKTEAVKEWYCSLCQVSASSERNLKDHFEGKKHKAKEEMSRQETENTDCKLVEEVSELVETTGKTEPGNHQEDKQETSNELGLEKVEQETPLTASEDVEKLEGGGYISKEMSMENVKYWHCQMCNEETCDEAAMAAHRKSDKHMALLHKNGGGVIVVSRIRKEAVEHGKGAQIEQEFV